MKVCSKCKEEKELDFFGKNKRKKDGLQDRCKICQAEADKKHYEKTKKVYLEKVKKYQIEFKKERREFYKDYKQKLNCKKCNEKRWYCLEFHHLDPLTKENNISFMILNLTKESLLKEIEKCVVLCSNCHKEFHYVNKENKITIQEYLNYTAFE